MEIAVSSGVLAPRSSPIGERSLASSCSVSPASRSRVSRSSCVRLLPIAPMYPAGVRSATSSSGTSNFGSCVSTQIAVRASTSVPARKRCGQSTTTSSASGNRDAVANTFLASHTVTWYPRNFPVRATAAAKSIAPNTSIRGGGAKEFTNTLSSSPRRSPCAPYRRTPVTPWASMPSASSSTAASSRSPDPSVPDAP